MTNRRSTNRSSQRENILSSRKYQQYVVKTGVRAIHAECGKVLVTDLRNVACDTSYSADDPKSLVKGVTVHDQNGKVLGLEYLEHQTNRWKCPPDLNELQEWIPYKEEIS